MTVSVRQSPRRASQLPVDATTRADHAALMRCRDLFSLGENFS
jgi:hypothetical protein